MGGKLNSFISSNYSDVKFDLFAVFILKGLQLLKKTELCPM